MKAKLQLQFELKNEKFSYLEKKINLSLIDSLIRIKIYKKKMQYASDKELGMMNEGVISIMGILGKHMFQDEVTFIEAR